MRILNVQWEWTVPNVLSLLRIVLIAPFMVLYLSGYRYWALLMLVLSGLSDMVDGFIARRFNQITDCGKLLDPLSDKMTQVAVVVTLTIDIPEMLPLTVLCFFKEAVQVIGAVLLLMLKVPVKGSLWFGKLSTIVFYVCMSIMVVWKSSVDEFALAKISENLGIPALLDKVGLSMVPADFGLSMIPEEFSLVLIVLSAVFMLVAFVGYARVFFHAFREKNEAQTESERQPEEMSERG